MKVLITGSAGFIGFHLSKRLLSKGISVIGIDDFNSYYSSSLKYDRNKILINESHQNQSDYFYYEKKRSKNIILLATLTSYLISIRISGVLIFIEYLVF